MVAPLAVTFASPPVYRRNGAGISTSTLVVVDIGSLFLSSFYWSRVQGPASSEFPLDDGHWTLDSHSTPQLGRQIFPAIVRGYENDDGRFIAFRAFTGDAHRSGQRGAGRDPGEDALHPGKLPGKRIRVVSIDANLHVGHTLVVDRRHDGGRQVFQSLDAVERFSRLHGYQRDRRILLTQKRPGAHHGPGRTQSRHEV